MDYSQPGSFVHGDSPGKNTEEGCHALLQGIFPTQVSYISGGFFPSEPTGKPTLPTFQTTFVILNLLELVLWPNIWPKNMFPVH